MGMAAGARGSGSRGDSNGGMAGMFGLRPMSLAVANSLWITAIVLTIVSLAMSIRQGLRTRA
jgi:hypothetical protein